MPPILRPLIAKPMPSALPSATWSTAVSYDPHVLGSLLDALRSGLSARRGGFVHFFPFQNQRQQSHTFWSRKCASAAQLTRVINNAGKVVVVQRVDAVPEGGRRGQDFARTGVDALYLDDDANTLSMLFARRCADIFAGWREHRLRPTLFRKRNPPRFDIFEIEHGGELFGDVTCLRCPLAVPLYTVEHVDRARASVVFCRR